MDTSQTTNDKITNDKNIVINENKSEIKITNNVSLLVFNNNKKNQTILIPQNKDYKYFDKDKYTLCQLKQICKYLKVKVTGKKEVLYTRIYDSLKYNYFIIKIQSLIRKIITLNFFKIKENYSWKKNLLYINETDLYNLEPIKDIDFYNFFGFTDENNNSFGFSLYDLDKIISNTRRNNNVLNPYNKNEIHKSIIDDFKKIYKMSQKLNFIKSNKKIIVRQNFNIKYKIIDLFQHFDDLGNYTNANWFLNLNKQTLTKFYKELMDIWNYRANLTNVQKSQIAPYQTMFPYSVYNFNKINSLNKMKNVLLTEMEKLVFSADEDSNRSLGCYYILIAFVEINPVCAALMPWLVQV